MTTTSQVFDVMLRLYTLFSAEVTWPAHPVTAGLPTVALGGLVNEATREPVVVQGVPPELPELDFAVLGVVGIDEAFAIRVYIATTVPGQTGIQVLARLKALTRAVEIALRDQTTGRPAGAMPAPILWHRVARIAPVLSLGPEGVIGESAIDVVFQARI